MYMCTHFLRFKFKFQRWIHTIGIKVAKMRVCCYCDIIDTIALSPRMPYDAQKSFGCIE